jgi:3-deoxy-7-phosphoheptulonate synthase
MAGLLAPDDLPAAQQPTWPDAAALQSAVATLATYPPLVFAGECDVLKARMAAAARGEAFVLMGGDCAETFAGATCRQHPEPGQDDPPDGGGADLRRVSTRWSSWAGWPGSTPSRAQGHRGPRRPGASGLPRRHGQRLRLHGRESRASPTRSGWCAPTTRARHPQPRPGLHQGGFADLRHVHDWNRGLRLERRPTPATSDGARHRQGHAFMAACGADFEAMRPESTVGPPRGAAAGLRAAADAHRLPHRAALRTSGALPLGGERTRDLAGAHVDFVSPHSQSGRGQGLRPARDVDDLLRLADGSTRLASRGA